MDMNASSFNQYHNQEALAKEHRENILYALRMLIEATSGEIKKFIDKKVKSELEDKYNSVKYLSKDNKQTAKERRLELKQKQMSQRTVQKWLIQLQKDYFVSKNKYNIYRLTTEGLSKKIFGESYGKILFDSIIKTPLEGTQDKKVSEAIRRIGIYIFFIFMDNMWDKSLERNKNEWINDVINPNLMFNWFNNEFKSFSKFNFDPQFTEYVNTFKEAMKTYHSKVHPGLSEEYIRALKIRVEELNRELGRK